MIPRAHCLQGVPHKYDRVSYHAFALRLLLRLLLLLLLLLAARCHQPGFEPVRELMLRELVSGRFLAAQCTVYWRGVAVVDLCGAPNEVEVLSAPEEGEEGAQTETETSRCAAAQRANNSASRYNHPPIMSNHPAYVCPGGYILPGGRANRSTFGCCCSAL